MVSNLFKVYSFLGEIKIDYPITQEMVLMSPMNDQYYSNITATSKQDVEVWEKAQASLYVFVVWQVPSFLSQSTDDALFCKNDAQ